MSTEKILFVVSVSAVLLLPLIVLADDVAPIPVPKWLPALQLESDIGIGNNSRDIGLPQMMIPVWQDDKSMLFTDLRYRFDDEQSQEYNLGLGFRKEVTADWIIGGYGFFDRLSSASGNLYSQGTFGIEALSINNDARINVYVPQSTTHMLSSTEVGTPQVIINGGQISIQDPGTSNSFERALPGEDIEFGQKLPLDFADVRIYGGGYRYEADGFGMESGPRGRLELTLNNNYIPAIPFGAEVTLGGEIEHDQVRGTESFALLKLRIPLNGSEPYKTIGSLDNRMNTFIERDIDIITKKVTSITSGATEAAEVNGNVVSNVVNLNYAGNFTAAVNNAAANTLFLVDGTGGFVNGNGGAVYMKTGQTILGDGTTIAITGANSGRMVNYTFPGSLGGTSGVGSVPELYMANNTLIQNINFNNLSSGLNTNGSNNVMLSNDTFYESPLLIEGSNHVAFSNISATAGSPAILIAGAPSSNVALINVALHNETGGDGIHIDSNVNNLMISDGYINSGGSSGTGNSLTFSNVSISGLSGSGNTLISNGSNCVVSGSAISGNITFNGGLTCP